MTVIGEPLATIRATLDWYFDTHITLHSDSDETRRSVTSMIKRLKEGFGDLTPGELVDTHIEAYLVKRRLGIIGLPAVEGTVNKETKCLRAAINRAVRKRRLGKECTPTIDMPKPSRPRKGFLTRKQAANIFRAARKIRRMGATTKRQMKRLSSQEIFCWIALYTGARHEAIIELDWARVDFFNRVVNFKPELARETSKRRANVPMHPVLFHVLRRAFKERRDRNAQVFVLGAGRYNICRNLHALGAEAGVPGLHPHLFRHTFGTWLKSADESDHAVSGLMGASVRTVQRTYAKHMPAHLRSAIKAL